MAVCTTTLPAANADFCAPNAHFGRIDAILFTRWGDDLTDWTDDAEWATRISNSTALAAPGTDAAIRFLFGVGELPLPEATEVELSLGRTQDAGLKHVLTFNVEDTGSTNAALLTSLQNTSQTYAFWFLVDNQLYGGNTGFRATVKFKGRVIPNAKTALQTINVVASWEGVITAPIASPVNDAVGIE